MATGEVLFNPLLPEFHADPYPFYRRLREKDPVHQTPMGFWVLTRYDDCVAALRDARFGREEFQQMLSAVYGDDTEKTVLPRSMLFRDPPDHTRLRRLVSKAFTPRRIEALRPRIEELVDDSLDQAAAAGGFELISDFAFPLPFTVISELLGTPSTDTGALREWSGLLVRNLEPVLDPDMLRAMAAAAESMHGLISEIIA